MHFRYRSFREMLYKGSSLHLHVWDWATLGHVKYLPPVFPVANEKSDVKMAVRYPVPMIPGRDAKWGEIKCAKGRVSEWVSSMRAPGSTFPHLIQCCAPKRWPGSHGSHQRLHHHSTGAADTSRARCNSQPESGSHWSGSKFKSCLLTVRPWRRLSAAVWVITTPQPLRSQLKMELLAKWKNGRNTDSHIWR